MPEFSRRVDVEIINTEPFTPDEWNTMHPGWDVDDLKAAYARYLSRHQPYRWRAVAANNEPIAHGESYFNEADAINAAELLFGDDTTVYLQRHEKGNQLLRYGVTDRQHQAAQ